jgi:pSer/pThr/pTyr-binding forkhead associated (FHA) protein
MAGTICPNCNYENRIGNKFCTQCGTQLYQPLSSEPCLHILTQEETQAVIPIRAGKSTLGRNSSNAIVINDEMISSYHAMLTYENDAVWIEDLESRNGIFINGIRIEEQTQLAEGTLLRIGSTMLRFDTKRVTAKSEEK